jgi:hypothetical protein
MKNWRLARFAMQDLTVRGLAVHVGVAAVLCTAPGMRAQAPNAGTNRDVAAYQQHLENLESLVDACRKQRTRQACDPSQVGADDQMQAPSGGAAQVREIRYGWLRELLDQAGKKEEPQKAIAQPPQVIKTVPPTVDAQLAQARQRLEDDGKQAGGPPQTGAGHAAARTALTAILARREYQGVTQTSALERFQEWLVNWLDRILGRLAGFGARSPWIGYTLLALLLISVCVGLIWAVVRIERRSRIRLVPDFLPSAGAPSAREWQLWLEDARKMAAQGLWREAIHFLYWASISRLESKRLWPADRARTPREYVRLLPGADPRKTKLTALTRSFERTWYGGREARSSDFQAALQLAAELGVE